MESTTRNKRDKLKRKTEWDKTISAETDKEVIYQEKIKQKSYLISRGELYQKKN